MAKEQRNQNHQETEDKDLLLAIYGSKAFVKIYQALEIGKIKFSFVNKENPKEHIDCYIDADDFASDLIAIIDSDEIRKRAYNARQEQKATESKYAKDIWESRVGVSQSDANQLRKFTIQPGSSQDFTFRATQKNTNINVGFAHRELKLLSYRWHFLEADWNRIMAEKYSIKNMTSDYHSRQNKEQYQKQMAEEAAMSANATTYDSAPNESEQMQTPTYAVSSSNNTQPTQTSNTDSASNSTEQVPIQKISLKVKTPICDMKNGGKAFQGWGEDNKEYNIIIRKDKLEKADAALNSLMQSAATMGSKLSVKGTVVNDRIYVA